MPTYQYACTAPSCGHEFELVQSFTDPAATECPNCGAPVRKRFGSIGVVFKGSGFYRTDSRADAKKPAAANGADKTEKADKPAAAKSGAESSPASGKDAKAPAASGSGGTGKVAAST